jgi:hypothetical protein
MVGLGGNITRIPSPQNRATESPRTWLKQLAKEGLG